MKMLDDKPSMRLLMFFLLLAVAVSLLGILYGVFPGLRPSAIMQQFFLGLAACYAEHLPADIRCDAIAQPAGYTTMFGLPVVLMVAFLYKFGIALHMAGLIVEAVIIAIAAWGAHRLFMALGMRAWLAWMMVFLFLSSPIVFAQDHYGPLRLGFALVPMYGWLDLHFARRICRSTNGLSASGIAMIGLLVLSVARAFALYTDGYSFMMGLMLSASLVGSQWLRMMWQRRWAASALLPALFVVPTLLAYLSYRAYVGGVVESAVMPLDFFRGQGVDLFALAVPSAMHWLTSALGWAHHLNGWMTFSDGPNVRLVYLGWFLILPTLLLAVMAVIGKGLRKFRLEVVLVTMMTLAALVLSLGPSLKIADFRDQPSPDRGIVFHDYLMPESAASMSLGTGWVYMNVPGVQNMRAVYRWILLVKLGLIILAGMFLEYVLTRNPGHPLAYGLVALLMLELLPNVPSRLNHGQHQNARYHDFADEALAALKSMRLEDSRVVFVSSEPDTEFNHFSANFLCPLADLDCFNLGGDKSRQAARLEWPRSLRELSRGRHVVGNLRDLMLDESIDHVVMPLFSLRDAASGWPPQESVVQARLEYAEEIAGRIPARIVRHEWFLLLKGDKSRLRSERAVSLPEPGRVIEIDAWGPSATARGTGFNLQPDGRSAFWIRVVEISEPMDRFVVLLDGKPLETFHGGDIIAARFWREADFRALGPGAYALQILDRVSNQVQDLGVFIITPRAPQ